MLKIKDNFDLKELEKFGFKYNAETKHKNETYEVELKEGAIVVFIWNREIFAQDLDGLWDLIQAGLVEKIEERN